MKITSYNIQYGKGVDGRFDLARTCNTIRGADIICLQEVEQYWQRSGDIDQAAAIAGMLPTYYYVYGASFDVDASAPAAHGAVINRRRRHGNMVLSRWPISSSRSFSLPKQDYRRFNMQMGFLETVIDTGSRCLRVYNYHAGYLESGERQAQVAEFARVFKRSPTEGGAWSGKADIDGTDWSNGSDAPAMPSSAIVCGDFNSNHESEEYRQLLESTGLIDCWALKSPAEMRLSTLKFEPGDDVKMRGKIDHIFVTPDLKHALRSASIDVVADASDHMPLHVELDLS